MTKKHEQTAAEMVGDKKAEVKEQAATEVAVEAVKDEIAVSTGTEGEIDPKAGRFYGHDEIMLQAPMLDLSIDAFEKAISPKAEHTLAENKVYGLLALERNGRNRTPYVKAMMDRLGLKAGELPGGGPPYTNDLTNVTDL